MTIRYVPSNKIETPRRKVTVVNVQLQNRVANCRDAQGGETTVSFATTVGPFATIPSQGEKWWITLWQSNWVFDRKTDYQNPSLTAVEEEGDVACVTLGSLILVDKHGRYYNRPEVDAVVASARFTGETMEWWTATPPAGWLLENGAAVSRTTYAALFALLGTTFGVGNGSTTFNLPNRCGRVAVGYDSTQTEFNALGKTGGEKTHTLSTTEMPSHSHTQSLGGAISTVANVTGSYVVGNANSSAVSSTGGGEAHNNLQPYVAVNYIIKT